MNSNPATPTFRGFKDPARIIYQATPQQLIDATLRSGEGELSDTGALVIRTGKFTGRSPKDKFIVKDVETEKNIHWNEFNQPISEEHFILVRDAVLAWLNAQPKTWVRDCMASADDQYRIGIRVVNEKPWNNLFASNMFLRPSAEELQTFNPEWQIFSAPGLQLDPAVHGTRAGNATIVSFKEKTILIAGSGYTGETKKSIFTILNYILPMHRDVLPMHCSANEGSNGDTAIFFGLSGTGKTTLSSDPDRRLIGDDEHGWSDDGIFNFEGGCYAKTIHLTRASEPGIYDAIRSGALVENTRFFPGTNKIDFNDASVTENTRVSYPLDHVANAKIPSTGVAPRNIFMLTCDAFGVLPPISRLNPEQAMYQFISGYTARVAGTEAGVLEPKPTFSACFGAPFLPLHPSVYAEMLGRRMRKDDVNVWLINTGWTGGPYGTGERIRLKYTRAMIGAVLHARLGETHYEADPVFGLQIPVDCPGVPGKMLRPWNTWEDVNDYEQKATYLAGLFINNFMKYEDAVSEAIRKSAPNRLIRTIHRADHPPY